MRIIRHRLNNRIANAAVMVVLCVLLVGLIPIRAVHAAVMEVSLPYEQTWTNDSGRKVSNTFDYRMTAADGASPLPEESSGGSYDFSLTGNANGKKELHFAFSRPGYYHYKVTPVTGSMSEHYSYDAPEYDVMIMVINDTGGMRVGAMTIEDSVRAESGDKAKYAALQYSASYYYENPEKPEKPEKPQEPSEPQQPSQPQQTARSGGDPGLAAFYEEYDEPETDEKGKADDIIEEPEPQQPGIDLEDEDYWALLNLILMILTVLIALIDGILYFHDPDDDDEEDQKEQGGNSSADAQGGGQTEDEESEEVRKHGLIRLLALIVAIISIIVFILTEDMRLPMEWVDEYTIWMIILFIIEIILAFLSRKTRPDDEEGDEET